MDLSSALVKYLALGLVLAALVGALALQRAIHVADVARLAAAEQRAAEAKESLDKEKDAQEKANARIAELLASQAQARANLSRLKADIARRARTADDAPLAPVLRDTIKSLGGAHAPR